MSKPQATRRPQLEGVWTCLARSVESCHWNPSAILKYACLRSHSCGRGSLCSIVQRQQTILQHDYSILPNHPRSALEGGRGKLLLREGGHTRTLRGALFSRHVCGEVNSRLPACGQKATDEEGFSERESTSAALSRIRDCQRGIDYLQQRKKARPSEA